MCRNTAPGSQVETFLRYRTQYGPDPNDSVRFRAYRHRTRDLTGRRRDHSNATMTAAPPRLARSEAHPHANADYQRVDLERPQGDTVRRRAGAHPDFLG